MAKTSKSSDEKQVLSPEQIQELAQNIPNFPSVATTQIDPQQMAQQRQADQARLAEEIKKKIDATKQKAEPLQKELLNKYKHMIMGISILPPRPPQQNPYAPMPSLNELEKQIQQNEPEILVLLQIRDEDVPKPKEPWMLLNEKLKKKDEIFDFACKIRDEKLKGVNINCIILDEIWDACTKGKFDILNIITMGSPVYDTGWTAMLRAVEIHKAMVLKKFDRYVVSYAIVGSIIRGESHKDSDIDTFIVIDDTDVSRFTSQELRSKLLSIIWGMGGEACMQAGIGNKLNVQVYVLTDFWNSIREAHPVTFTMLREGVSLYDKGLFTPWKLLLQKGKIKPTAEAIDTYIKSGKQSIERVSFKLRDIAIEDCFWAVSIPAQGALMLDGEESPVPNKLASGFSEHFVKKRKLLTLMDVKPLEDICKLRKDVEYGRVKDIDAKMVKDVLDGANRFLKRIERLYTQLEREQIQAGISSLYKDTVEDLDVALAMVGKTTKNPVEDFKKFIVDKKLAPSRFYELVEKIVEAKEKMSLGREIIDRYKFEEEHLADDMFELIKAKKGIKTEQFKISAQYEKGKKTASIWMLTDTAFVLFDVNDPKTKIKKYKILETGAFEGGEESSLVALNEIVRKFKGTPTVTTIETIKSLKKILADDVKLVIGA